MKEGMDTVSKNKYLVVVGSCNMDLISYVDKRPERGETILGNRFEMGFGGKGANQAVAASRLGCPTHMVGKVGNDSFGSDTIKNFDNNGVGRDFVVVTNDHPTGNAPIVVEESGQNSIIVNAGANSHITCQDVEKAEELIAGSSVLVCQGEISWETTLFSLSLAKKHGVLTILNPAPAATNFIGDDIYRVSDIFCPNETECEVLSGVCPLDERGFVDVESADKALDIFLSRGCGTALITLGSQGAVYKTKDSVMEHVKPPVHVDNIVDTTGAGDAFVGSLAHFLVNYRGKEFREMVRRANHIAGVSIQKRGTQTSFPFPKDLPAHIFA